jgi:hypothetical protein
MSGPSGHPGVVGTVPLTTDTDATSARIKAALDAGLTPLLTYEVDNQAFAVFSDYKK